ncbi:MAG: hypothetical protein HWE10_10180 [Gammaproteobacteria bacterium]|nr:hypothetical protein [Gammaproteobacteria bacterium]
MSSNDEKILAAKFDGISKGLRMGMAEIYGQLLAFDKVSINDNKPSLALEFLQQQAAALGQSLDEFMEEQTEYLQEYYEYRDMINELYEVSDKYGYEE